jgi:hypothetical protein
VKERSFKGSYFQGRWSGGQWNRRMKWNKNLTIFVIANMDSSRATLTFVLKPG